MPPGCPRPVVGRMKPIKTAEEITHAMTLDIDPLDLVDPSGYQRYGRPQELWTQLRAEAPVAYFEPPGYPPFWAITKHADLIAVASQP